MIYIGMRYKMSSVTRLAMAILFFLAVFQLAEYNICEGSWGIDSLTWARLGYVAITILPPLGIHLAARLAGKSSRSLITAAYASGAAFAGFFLFAGHGMQGQQCLGNYVIFQVAPDISKLYGLYYYGWMFTGVLYAWKQSSQMKQASRARALKSLMVGYALLIIPTSTVNLVDPSTLKGIPSIMCGFAVLLAVVLVSEVMPQFHKRESFVKALQSRFNFNR